MIFCLTLATALIIAGSSMAHAQQTAIELGKHGDWIVHQSAGEGTKICFVAASPRFKEPAGANRAKVVLYVSAWPKEGVKSEVSIKLGYPIKAGSEVAVAVGTDAFTLFAKEDRAYVSDPTEELKLVEAMKAGQKLVVRASSERGTATSDTYSLVGFGQALQALEKSCR